MTNLLNFLRPLLHFFTQNRTFAYFSLFLALTLLIFLISWLYEPRRLVNGIFFTLFLLFLAAWGMLLVFATHLKILFLVCGSLALFLLFLTAIFIIFAWLFCFWNAYFVWKYESHTLPNLLTLILGIIFILLWLVLFLNPHQYFPHWLDVLLTAAPAIGAYLGLVMYNFLINLLLYQFVPRRYNQDYLIVLGAGLLNGEKVSPLLANRINRAIQFADKQIMKGRKRPKFIMSGGQGPDEKVAEAQAMREYALTRGISASDILLETQSRNTYQNMLFSKEVAQKDFGSNNFKAKFFSNNYHIFRAGLYARLADLNANGVGCYTRPYFLPNAIIREFAGVFVMHKKRHFTIIILITIFFLIQALLILFGFAKGQVI